MYVTLLLRAEIRAELTTLEQVAPFMPALAAGLPPTLVNDKGDSLVGAICILFSP